MTSNDNVICISYSGNTAETLSAAKKANEMGCQIEIITTGGELGDLADKHNWDKTIVESGHQPKSCSASSSETNIVQTELSKSRRYDQRSVRTRLSDKANRGYSY